MKSIIHNSKEQGFTLIEVMVSISIFAIIVSVGIGALFNMNLAYSYSKAQQRIADQLNFALENMMREMRTGQNYTCNGSVEDTPVGIDCPNGGSSIIFSSNEEQTGAEAIYYGLDGSTITKTTIVNEVSSSLPILPDEVEITDFNITVFGTADKQPIVRVVIAGSTTIRQRTEEFTIQMSVTQRAPNF